MECLICHKETDNSSGIHVDCKMCVYCGEPVIELHINQALQKQHEVWHPWCRDKHLRATVLDGTRTKTLEATEEIIQFLNEFSNCITPQMDSALLSDKQRAMTDYTAFHQRWLKDLTLEEQYRRGQLLEAIAVAHNLLLPRKEAKRAHEEHEVKRTRKNQEDEKLSDTRIREQKNQKEREKLDPRERAFRKSVDAFMALGMGEDAAKSEVRRMMGTGDSNETKN